MAQSQSSATAKSQSNQVASFSRSFDIPNEDTVRYAEHRGTGAPLPALGVLGDIYLDIKTPPSLYARCASGWTAWPGPKVRVEALAHPEHPSHVLWASTSRSRPLWLPKSKMKKLIGSAADVLTQIIASEGRRDSKNLKRKAGEAPSGSGEAKKPRVSEPAPSAASLDSHIDPASVASSSKSSNETNPPPPTAKSVPVSSDSNSAAHPAKPVKPPPPSVKSASAPAKQKPSPANPPADTPPSTKPVPSSVKPPSTPVASGSKSSARTMDFSKINSPPPSTKPVKASAKQIRKPADPLAGTPPTSRVKLSKSAENPFHRPAAVKPGNKPTAKTSSAASTSRSETVPRPAPSVASAAPTTPPLKRSADRIAEDDGSRKRQCVQPTAVPDESPFMSDDAVEKAMKPVENELVQLKTMTKEDRKRALVVIGRHIQQVRDEKERDRLWSHAALFWPKSKDAMQARVGSELKDGYGRQVAQMKSYALSRAGAGVPSMPSSAPSDPPPLPSNISELAREPDTVPTPAPAPLPAAKPTIDGVLKVMRKNTEILKSTPVSTPQAQASSPSVMEDATRPRSTATAARARPKRSRHPTTVSSIFNTAVPTSSSKRGDKSTVPTPERIPSPVQTTFPSSSPTQSGNNSPAGGSPTASTDLIAALHRQYTRYQSASVSQRRASEPWLAESAAAATLIGALSAANEALKRENEAIKAENVLLKGIAARLDADSMEIGQGDGEKEHVDVEPQQEEEAKLGQEEHEPVEPLREEQVDVGHEEEVQPREEKETELRGEEAEEKVEPPQEEEMELPQEEEMELGRGEEEAPSMVEEPDRHEEPPKVQQKEEEEEAEEEKAEHRPEEEEEEEELIMIDEHFQPKEPVEPRREEQVEPRREEEHDEDPVTIEEVTKNVPAPAKIQIKRESTVITQIANSNSSREVIDLTLDDSDDEDAGASAPRIVAPSPSARAAVANSVRPSGTKSPARRDPESKPDGMQSGDKEADDVQIPPLPSSRSDKEPDRVDSDMERATDRQPSSSMRMDIDGPDTATLSVGDPIHPEPSSALVKPSTPGHFRMAGSVVDYADEELRKVVLRNDGENNASRSNWGNILSLLELFAGPSSAAPLDKWDEIVVALRDYYRARYLGPSLPTRQQQSPPHDPDVIDVDGPVFGTADAPTEEPCLIPGAADTTSMLAARVPPGSSANPCPAAQDPPADSCKNALQLTFEEDIPAPALASVRRLNKTHLSFLFPTDPDRPAGDIACVVCMSEEGEEALKERVDGEALPIRYECAADTPVEVLSDHVQDRHPKMFDEILTETEGMSCEEIVKWFEQFEVEDE